MNNKRLEIWFYRCFVIGVIFLIQIKVFSQKYPVNDYFNNKQQKQSFDDKTYHNLKKKIIQESSSSSSNSESFGGSNFSKELPEYGDHYDFEEEAYKGEYDGYNSESNENDYYNKGQSNSGASSDDYDNYNNGGYDYYEKQYNQDTYDDYQQSKPKNESKAYNKYNPKSNTAQKLQDNTPSSTSMQFMQVVLIAFGAILLAFFIYYFFLRFNVDENGLKIINESSDISPLDIPLSELEKRLNAALKDENYREAIRIYFIFIIKDLSEKKWIIWEKEKTNYAYLVEMRKRHHYSLFNESVTIFEWVWYGHYKVDSKKYFEWENTFKQLLDAIKKDA